MLWARHRGCVQGAPWQMCGCFLPGLHLTFTAQRFYTLSQTPPRGIRHPVPCLSLLPPPLPLQE